MMVGSAVATGSFGPDQVVSGLTSAGTALGLGLYTGIRRKYLVRLYERALFARALASFLPPEVAELVEASPSALSLQGELEVTVLFSDIRGFSTFAEQVPPRQVAEVIGRHLGAMAAVVRAHGGMLDKFAGDAVMAVFGAPNPVADHAGRAVRCGGDAAAPGRAERRGAGAGAADHQPRQVRLPLPARRRRPEQHDWRRRRSTVATDPALHNPD
jgi:adenylate cyclase